uniref:uncharacterized protein LOC100183123 n=1 Tax=Ciona intestinalis TaxID=7719 RepID=UPI000180D404|nr:uncharacterized protein LOC100183123 [Ciona intestinalis]|eukprot:XP_002122848.1 uncharacterized protein LOC100183123 [Ciona intestinalis]
MDSEGEFRLLLHQICEGLTGENVSMMKFLCKDAIPRSRELETALDFMEYFEAKGWIQEGDLGFLAEVLYRINRHDLLKLLPGVKNRRDYEENFQAQQNNFTTYRVVCFMLADELTEGDLKILKRLCAGKMSKANVRRSVDVLSWLTCMEEEDLLSEGDLDFIMSILQHLDNQKPYKLFQRVRMNDNTVTLPKNQQKSNAFQPNSHLPVASGFNSLSKQEYNHTSKLEPQYVSMENHRAFNGGYNQYNNYQSGQYENSSHTTTPKQSLNFHNNNREKTFQNVDESDTTWKQNTTSGSSTAPYSYSYPHRQNEPMTENPSFYYTGNNSTTMPSVPIQNAGSSETLELNRQQDYSGGQSNQFPYPTQYSGVSSNGNPIVGTTNNVGCDGTPMVRDYPNGFETPPPRAQPKAPVSEIKDTSTMGILDKYPMERRGYCLIINNENFERQVNEDEIQRRLQMTERDFPVPNVGLKDRTGSGNDTERLENLFKEFGFILDVRKDLDQREMEKVIQEYTKKDHSDKDCFVCVVMSHGLSGCVYGVDGLSLSTSKISKSFRPGMCSSLTGKPKIFFFQACQGDRTMDGHSAPVDDVESDGAASHGRQVLPSESDFLIGHSTVPGYLSYRSRTDGSWFISTLVDSLEKYHEKEDLLSIMINVNQEMASKPYKQMPMPIATLRKKVFFSKQNSNSSSNQNCNTPEGCL